MFPPKRLSKKPKPKDSAAPSSPAAHVSPSKPQELTSERKSRPHAVQPRRAILNPQKKEAKKPAATDTRLRQSRPQQVGSRSGNFSCRNRETCSLPAGNMLIDYNAVPGSVATSVWIYNVLSALLPLASPSCPPKLKTSSKPRQPPEPSQTRSTATRL